MTLLLLEKDVSGDTESTATEKEANISPLDKILPVLSVTPSIIPKAPLQRKKEVVDTKRICYQPCTF